MTPPMVLQRTTRDDLHSFIAEQCLPRLREELRAKGDERRLRVTDLPLPVMERLAQALDAEGSGGKWVARVLTAVAAACLVVYDMVKAVDRTMEIGAIRLVSKTGGTRGDWARADT